MRKGRGRYVIGIDEVGRGALAGPVVVVATLVPVRSASWLKKGVTREFGPLKDSKKLTAAQREAWNAHFKAEESGVRFAAARVYPRGIERLNISGAANRAAMKAFTALVSRNNIEPENVSIVLDGGLFIGNKRLQQTMFGNAKTMPKADETVPAVAAASIIAKVSRDRFMTKLARRWPAYAFEIHKGYGTKAHRAALAKAGPCEAHRLTFLTKNPILNGN